jgi:hypothetical protein
MKKWINAFYGLLGLIAFEPVAAQTCIKPGIPVTHSSFAVIVDEQTYRSCDKVINEYRQTLESEGLPTFVLYKAWNKPEEVKAEIQKLYKTAKLEGVVLIGDIPIPMIRKAQHMTSAFKMDELRYPIMDSSVPSDRFYDDLHLSFDFIKRDSLKTQFFYYNLSANSPQEINCNIYSGRIKALNNGTDKNEQIRSYLAKAIKEHKAHNVLNQFASYTGDGSYSNSLTAWASEMSNLREQFSDMFDSPKGSSRFFRFSFFDYPKDDIINQLKRRDLDFMIFHEHGMPYRQYLSGIPFSYNLDGHITQIKDGFRYGLRNNLDKNKNAYAGYVKRNLEAYGLDSTWVAGYNDPAILVKDSLMDIRRGLLLDDITRTEPNARFVILDACYNGDFREDDYIAGRYIFAKGQTVAVFANSVNVLQDKQANEMLGLLGLGSRIGQWARLTNILESHIIGDPTFFFTSSDSKFSVINWLAKNYTDKEWLEFANDSKPCDVQNYALHMLYYNRHKGISSLLRHKYETTKYAMVRYTCFSLLERIGDKNFNDVLKLAVNDTYEFLRRIAIDRMGKVGSPEFLPYIVNAYINDRLSERVNFNVLMALRSYDKADIERVVKEQVSHSFVLDKDAVIKTLTSSSVTGLADDFKKDIFDRSKKDNQRRFSITGLKNMNIHSGVEDFIKVALDKTESNLIRSTMLQSLAWFNLSYKRDLIIKACAQMIKDPSLDKSLQEEALRTYNRLNKRFE